MSSIAITPLGLAGFGFPALVMPRLPFDWLGMLKLALDIQETDAAQDFPRRSRCRGKGYPDHARQRRADGAR
ncbi:hypothetical protein PSEUDO8O_50337 [Pseudomonas sp. 8O]|nr:hypothetical protein PSEUDO8O_50337 [Pseudomonas sp. 8O]